MDVYEAVRTVLAVREFERRAVPEAVARRVVEAARLTASSKNGQPWHFIVVQDHDTLRRLGALVSSGAYTAQADFAVVVAIDRSSPFGVSDASRAIQSMVLTAWAEGVGSNWTGWVGMTGVGELLGVPPGIDVIAVVPFGLPRQAGVAGQEAPQAPLRGRPPGALRPAVRLMRAGRRPGLALGGRGIPGGGPQLSLPCPATRRRACRRCGGRRRLFACRPGSRG